MSEQANRGAIGSALTSLNHSAGGEMIHRTMMYSSVTLRVMTQIEVMHGIPEVGMS